MESKQSYIVCYKHHNEFIPTTMQFDLDEFERATTVVQALNTVEKYEYCLFLLTVTYTLPVK